MKWIKPVRGLRKRCSHFKKNEFCLCDWVINYGDLDRFNLTVWNNPTDPRPIQLDEAEAALALLKKEMAFGTFDRAGRTGAAKPVVAPPVMVGPTLSQFLDDTYKPLKFKKHGYHVDRCGDEWIKLRRVTGEWRIAPARSLGALNSLLLLQDLWGKENLIALSEMKPSDWAKRFAALQEDRGVGQRTMNRYFTTMSAVFNAAIDDDLVKINPFGRNKLFKKDRAADKKKRDRRLSREFEAKLIRECRARGHQPISPRAFRNHSTTGWEMYRRIVGALDLGPRSFEMLSMRASWVRLLEDGIIEIVTPADQHKGGHTTGEDVQRLAMTPRIQRILRKRVKQLLVTDGQIFGREDGSPCESFDKSWKSLFKRVGLGGTRATFTFHDLKHEFMSRVGRSTRSLDLIKKMGDHQDPRTSMGYMTADQDEHLQVARNLNLSGRGTRRTTRPKSPATTV